MKMRSCIHRSLPCSILAPATRFAARGERNASTYDRNAERDTPSPTIARMRRAICVPATPPDRRQCIGSRMYISTGRINIRRLSSNKRPPSTYDKPYACSRAHRLVLLSAWCDARSRSTIAKTSSLDWYSNRRMSVSAGPTNRDPCLTSASTNWTRLRHTMHGFDPDAPFRPNISLSAFSSVREPANRHCIWPLAWVGLLQDGSLN